MPEEPKGLEQRIGVIDAKIDSVSAKLSTALLLLERLTAMEEKMEGERATGLDQLQSQMKTVETTLSKIRRDTIPRIHARAPRRKK